MVVSSLASVGYGRASMVVGVATEVATGVTGAVEVVVVVVVVMPASAWTFASRYSKKSAGLDLSSERSSSMATFFLG